jgi:two-component system OmpR family response regulator
MTPAKILIVEDDASLQQALSYNLGKEGYEVFSARNGAEALNIFQLNNPDLVLLDVMLPVMSGLEVCRILRKESNLPILMLTARTEEMDKVEGLDIGADDYMTKPFGMRELMARIRALLRRENSRGTSEEKLSLGDITVDPARHIAMRAGKTLDLTPNEFDL